MSFLDAFVGLRSSLSKAIPYKRYAVGFTLLASAFQILIDLRQYAKLHHPLPPASLTPVLSCITSDKKGEDKGEEQGVGAKAFFKSQAYARAKLHFSLISAFVNLAESLLLLLNIDRLWHGSAARLDNPSPILTSLVFLTLTSALSMITSLPASYYKTFFLEEKFGFNKSTKRTWAVDQIKMVLLTAAFGLPLMAGALWIIERFGERFVLYMMGFFLALQIVLVPLYPAVIAPIFNKFRSISEFPEHKKVQDLVEALGKKMNFPIGKIWVIDGSTRSAHSNAYFTGLPFLSKNIVLYDTLLKDHTPEQVEAVLAHELGHFKHYDSLRMMGMGQFNLFCTLTLYALFLFEPALFRSFGIKPSSAFGANKGCPIIVGFSLAGALLAPLEAVAQFSANAFSRKLEFAADRFAAEQGYQVELKNALATLMSKNAQIYDIDPLYSALHHSHPTVSERVNALDVWTSKNAAGQKKGL